MQILIIESDAPCAEALSFALANAGYEIEHAPTGRQGLRILADQEPPDGVLVGHPLADQSGLDVCRAIRAASEVGLILVSSCTREETMLRAFAAGVDDAVVKPVRVAELTARVGAVLRRRQVKAAREPGALVERGPFRLNSNRLEAAVAGRPAPVRLTPLEAKLLGLLMLNANQVMTKARLQELIWGYQNDSSGDLLKTHIRHLRMKLEASPSSPRFIQTINGVGYTFVSPRPAQLADLDAPVTAGTLLAGVPAAGSPGLLAGPPSEPRSPLPAPA